MMKRQAENIKTALTLIEQNPSLRIVPMVDSEVVADDGFGWWVAEWGKASIEEIWSDNERVYIRSVDEDTLVENPLDDDSEDVNGDIEWEKAKKTVSEYEWEKVIAVKITI